MPDIDSKKLLLDRKVTKLLTKINEEKRVIVHCQIQTSDKVYIRIWPSTYLIDQDSNHRSRLLHAENISYFPVWWGIEKNTRHHFTLIFEGLPRTCNTFSLIEEIPDRGGFTYNNLGRNSQDIYNIKL